MVYHGITFNFEGLASKDISKIIEHFSILWANCLSVLSHLHAPTPLTHIDPSPAVHSPDPLLPVCPPLPQIPQEHHQSSSSYHHQVPVTHAVVKLVFTPIQSSISPPVIDYQRQSFNRSFQVSPHLAPPVPGSLSQLASVVASLHHHHTNIPGQ